MAPIEEEAVNREISRAQTSDDLPSDGSTISERLGLFAADRSFSNLPISVVEVCAKWGQDKVLPRDDSFSVPFDELSDDRFVLGTPDGCIAALLPWKEKFGADHFVIRTDWAGMPADISSGSVRLLADEVLPALCAR